MPRLFWLWVAGLAGGVALAQPGDVSQPVRAGATVPVQIIAAVPHAGPAVVPVRLPARRMRGVPPVPAQKKPKVPAVPLPPPRKQVPGGGRLVPPQYG